MSMPCDYGHCDPDRCSRSSECDELIHDEKGKVSLLAGLLSTKHCPIEIISNLLMS